MPHAVIHSDYPLNTPVFRIRAIVSSIDDLLDLSMQFSQTLQINNIFDFEGSDSDTITILPDDMVPLGDVYVFDTAINLVQNVSTEFTESDEYPVILNIDVFLIALISPSFDVFSSLSKGTGEINVPGKCAINYPLSCTPSL